MVGEDRGAAWKLPSDPHCVGMSPLLLPAQPHKHIGFSVPQEHH